MVHLTGWKYLPTSSTSTEKNPELSQWEREMQFLLAVRWWVKYEKKHKHPQKKVFWILATRMSLVCWKRLGRKEVHICNNIHVYIYIRIFFIFLIVVGPKLPASNWLTSRFGSVACFFCCISPKDTTAIFSSKSHSISTFNFTVSVCNGFFFHCFLGHVYTGGALDVRLVLPLRNFKAQIIYGPPHHAQHH